jgi:hypothetical protein
MRNSRSAQMTRKIHNRSGPRRSGSDILFYAVSESFLRDTDIGPEATPPPCPNFVSQMMKERL